MAEIRIPSDQIPADIWRRLRDISNKVVNPSNTHDNASSLPLSSSSSSSSSSSLSSSSLLLPSSIQGASSASQLEEIIPQTHPFQNEISPLSIFSTTTAAVTSMSQSQSQSYSVPSSCSSNRNYHERLRGSRSTAASAVVSKNRVRAIHRARRHNEANYDDNDDVDEIDGGDVDSSIVHVVDDAVLRHQKSSRAFAMEVMDESDIVRIFPDADVTTTATTTTTTSSSKSVGDLKSAQSSRGSDDSGIVRIFPNRDDDIHHHDNDGEDNDHTDVVDHMSLSSFSSSLSSSSSSTTTKTTTTTASAAAAAAAASYNNFRETISPEKTAFNKTASSINFPNSVQEGRLNFKPTPYSMHNIHEQDDTQSAGQYDLDERPFRKHLPTSRFSHYKDVRRKILPGKSANTDVVYTSDPFVIQAQILEQYRRMQNQNSSQDSSGNNSSTAAHSNDSLSINPVVNNMMMNSMSNLASSNTSKYASTLETTPTKVLPSKFGKIRRSPVLLPTPPQTPDDADGDDDDDVFSYDVISRSCTNIDNASPQDSAHFRRNSDSRAMENERGVRRSSTRSSPFPFSPTHKMARMKVGDRQQTRKRLSFEDIDSTAAESMNDMDHNMDSSCWSGSNTILNNDIRQSEKVLCSSNASQVHKINNSPRGKAISPFNSPPHSSYQHILNPASKSTNSAPFSGFNTNFIDAERHHHHHHYMVRPSTSVQVCTSQGSSPRPSHRQMTLASNCQPSITMSHSDQSYSFIHGNNMHHDVTTNDKDVTPDVCHSRYSPSKQLSFPIERKPRMRIHSEGFSGDTGEHLSDVTRLINSNDDGFFLPRPRVQTLSSYGKRRRFECDEEEDVVEEDRNAFLAPIPSTPKKTSPALSLNTHNTSNNTTTNINNITIASSPSNNNNNNNNRYPIPLSYQAEQVQDISDCTNNLPSPINQQQQQQHQTISTPRSNCSCATFMRNFLSMASGAYENLNATTGDFTKFRQEMANINFILRESMSILYKINTICEHHKTNPTTGLQQADAPPPQASFGATSSETITQSSPEKSPSRNSPAL